MERENNDNFVLYFFWRTIKSLEKKFLIDKLYLQYILVGSIYKNLDNRVQNKNNARFNFVLIDKN